MSSLRTLQFATGPELVKKLRESSWHRARFSNELKSAASCPFLSIGERQALSMAIKMLDSEVLT